MNCKHSNPAGYLFCGKCGEALKPALCRCGFVLAADDVFCGRCGTFLETSEGNRAFMDVDHRYDLERLVQQAEQERQFLETTHKARVTQDDIRKLLTRRRKKF